MKQSHAKFPLMLLTLLNYAPYTYTNHEANTIAELQAATTLVTDVNSTVANADTLVHNFVNSDIPEFFDTLFDSHFSGKTRKNSNELYTLLSQSPLTPSIRIKEIPFELEEFEQEIIAHLTIKDNSVEITCDGDNYISRIPLAFFNALGCDTVFKATINPTHNVLFLHFGNNQAPEISFIGLINTRTLISMIIPCASEKEIKTIGICTDAIHLGIVRNDDTLLSYDLPTEIVSFAPSLKQRAFMSYVDSQINMIYGQLAQSGNPIKVYAKLPLNKVNNIAWLIQSNKAMLPESLYVALYNEKLNLLQHILSVAYDSQYVANALNVDVDTLADKIASQEVTQEQWTAILASAPSPAAQ